MRKEKQRLLTGLLCMVLFVSNIASVGMQVQAGALEIGQQSSVEQETIE